MNNALQGLRILNTRPKTQGQYLAEGIIQAGGISVDYPLFFIESTKSSWIEKIPPLSEVHKVIFISANAVHCCFERLKYPWPEHIETFAIGKSTEKALINMGIQSIHTPEIANSQHLLALPELIPVSGQTILLFKGEGGLPVIENTLIQRQSKLIILEVYKRTTIKPDVCYTNAIWQNDMVDIIIITSEEILNHLFNLFPADWICSKPCLLVSERLAQKAKNMGIKQILISAPDTILDTLMTFSRTPS